MTIETEVSDTPDREAAKAALATLRAWSQKATPAEIAALDAAGGTRRSSRGAARSSRSRSTSWPSRRFDPKAQPTPAATDAQHDRLTARSRVRPARRSAASTPDTGHPRVQRQPRRTLRCRMLFH